MAWSRQRGLTSGGSLSCKFRERGEDTRWTSRSRLIVFGTWG